MYAGEIIESGTVREVYEGQKQHPYTRGLFGSIPDLETEAERLNPIEGLMPDPTNLPAGCKFHPRCDKCMSVCRHQPPPVFREGSHLVACHLYGQEPPSLGKGDPA